MRYLLMSTLIVLVSVGSGLFAQPSKDAPPKLVFTARNGNITFDHAAHSKRAKDVCATCHPKFWAQAKGDLKYKAGMHRPAETAKTSCGACHHAGGPAFQTKGNCTKCHVKAAAK